MAVWIMKLCVFTLNFKLKVYEETRSNTVEILETTFRPNKSGQMNKNQPANQQTSTSILTELQGAVELAEKGGGVLWSPRTA